MLLSLSESFEHGGLPEKTEPIISTVQTQENMLNDQKINYEIEEITDSLNHIGISKYPLKKRIMFFKLGRVIVDYLKNRFVPKAVRKKLNSYLLVASNVMKDIGNESLKNRIKQLRTDLLPKLTNSQLYFVKAEKQEIRKIIEEVESLLQVPIETIDLRPSSEIIADIIYANIPRPCSIEYYGRKILVLSGEEDVTRINEMREHLKKEMKDHDFRVEIDIEYVPGGSRYHDFRGESLLDSGCHLQFNPLNPLRESSGTANAIVSLTQESRNQNT